MKTVFQVKDFNLFYDKFHALKNINLEIYRNKVIALIGPSGCGKSTFLRSLNKMNDFVDTVKQSGSIIFEDRNILEKVENVEEFRKRVGMIFQKPNPFKMSIFDNVAYGLVCGGLKDKQELHQRVEKALKQAALWDEVKDNLKKNALMLSGGQQQRLCIARAIALQPDVLLMDEPTSALDPISTKKIEQLIEELKVNYTIVIVTHSMQQAARISDYTAFFLNGELIEYDDSKTFFKNPKDQRSEDYITGRFG